MELGPNYRESFLNFITYIMIMSFPVNGLELPRPDLWVPFEKSTDPIRTRLFARDTARGLVGRRTTLLDEDPCK